MTFTDILQLTCDGDGRILSAYRIPDARGEFPLRTGVVDDRSRGIRSLELALPAELAGLELPELAESFRVEIVSDRPTLIRTCESDRSAD